METAIARAFVNCGGNGARLDFGGLVSRILDYREAREGGVRARALARSSCQGRRGS